MLHQQFRRNWNFILRLCLGLSVRDSLALWFLGFLAQPPDLTNHHRRPNPTGDDTAPGLNSCKSNILCMLIPNGIIYKESIFQYKNQNPWLFPNPPVEILEDVCYISLIYVDMFLMPAQWKWKVLKVEGHKGARCCLLELLEISVFSVIIHFQRRQAAKRPRHGLWT